MGLINKRIFLVLTLLCCLPSLAGDGKMFVTRGAPPPTIPAQRALIVHDAGVQILVLQSGYNISPGEMVDSASLGWVVPVPGVPEVATFEDHWGWQLFRQLTLISPPRLLRISLVLLMFWVITCPLSLIMAVVLHVWSQRGGSAGAWCWTWSKRLYVYAGMVFVLMFFYGLTLPASMTLGPVQQSRVRILDHHQVGIYDVRVIAGDDAADIITWLDEQGFAYDDQDQTAFASYVERGWCFVVVRINEAVVSGEVEALMLQPLILRFAHPEPVYPLALTGTGGHDTHVELHVIASQQMADDERLPRIFAGPVRRLEGFMDDAQTDPVGILRGCLPEGAYLTTFSGLLRPEDMATDLVLTPAPERGDFRERVIRW